MSRLILCLHFVFFCMCYSVFKNRNQECSKKRKKKKKNQIHVQKRSKLSVSCLQMKLVVSAGMCCNLKKTLKSFRNPGPVSTSPLPSADGPEPSVCDDFLTVNERQSGSVQKINVQSYYYLQFNVSFVVDVTLFFSFFVNTLFFLRMLLFSRLVCETFIPKRNQLKKKKCVISFNSKFSCNVFANIYNTFTFFKEWDTLWTK